MRELSEGENWKNNTILLLIIWVGMETLFQQVGMMTIFSMIDPCFTVEQKKFMEIKDFLFISKAGFDLGKQ